MDALPKKGKRKADPAKKSAIREILRRMELGIMQPRYCHYTENEAWIEFGVICHLFKAIGEADRFEIALCVKELFNEGLFNAKDWVTEHGDDEDTTYTFPPRLYVSLE